MKKQPNMLFASLSKEEMTNFTNEVKETIAFGLVEPARKMFTSAELWNIQRSIKSTLQRRYY